MPFGLTNAPATFQHTLDILLYLFKWKSVVVYIDDVVTYSNTVAKHITHVDETLTVIREAGVSLKLPKCELCSSKVTYLGHITRPGDLLIDPVTVRCLRDALPPRTQSELRSFLGLWNVYCRFVRNFSNVAPTRSALLRKDAPAVVFGR